MEVVTDESMDDVEDPRSCQALRVPPYDWTQLPLRFWEKVLEYLDSNDRWSMSQTLNIWKELVFESPHLWRSVVFRFPRHQLVGANDNLVYIRSFGQVMSNVKMSYNQMDFFHRGRCELEIKTLFQSIPFLPSLTSFEMRNLMLHAFWTSETAKKRYLKSFCDFLRRQNLIRISLTEARVMPVEGIKILRTLASVAPNLKELNITNLIRHDVEFGPENYENLLSRLRQLNVLSIDSAACSPNTLNMLINNNLSLQHLKICIRKNEMMSVSGDLWRQVAAKRPQLQVHYVVEKLEHVSVIYRRLPPGTPIHSFRFVTSERVKTGESARLPGTMPELSWYLSRNFRDTLEHIDLDFGRFQSPTLSVAVQTLIANLPHLRTLKVRAALSTSGWLGLLDECFNSAHELKKINLICADNGVMEIMEHQLNDGIQFYTEVFHSKGVILNHKNFL